MAAPSVAWATFEVTATLDAYELGIRYAYMKGYATRERSMLLASILLSSGIVMCSGVQFLRMRGYRTIVNLFVC